jgi:hypothetical protein
MGKVQIPLLLFLAVALGNPALSEEKRVVVEPLDSSLPDTQKNWAVIMGVNQFADDNVNQLSYAVADAESVYEELTKPGGLVPRKQAYLHVTGQEGKGAPTREDVLESISFMAGNAPEDGLVIVYLSSHGFTDDLQRSYVMPENGRLRILKDTALPMARIQELLTPPECKARKRLLIVDACRNNPASGARGSSGEMSNSFVEELRKSQGLVTFVSCGKGEFSYEDPSLGHGVYTHFFLEGLRGAAGHDHQGFINSSTLGDYLSDQVVAWCYQNKKSPVQQPWLQSEQTRSIPLAVASSLPAPQQAVVMSSSANPARAMLRKAVGLYTGMSGRIDEEGAKALFISAAETHDPVARMWKAQLEFEGGCGFSEDETQAQGEALEVISDIQSLAALNDPEAVCLLAWAKRAGLGLSKDLDGAIRDYAEASKLGNPTAATKLGTLYRSSEKQDYPKALQYLAQGAEAGVAQAMIGLGIMHENGDGVEKDEKQALEWYRKAADRGHLDGMIYVGVMYENGTGVEKDEKMAVEWYRKAAEAGSPLGMSDLGTMYENGSGVEKDEQVAVEWYRKGAEAGSGHAMNNLGRVYDDGIGVERDQEQAAEWYRKGAKAGSAAAMKNLGVMYESGTGVEQDYEEAVKWYRKAADGDRPDAMVCLGLMYENGTGVERDPEQAVKLYRKAAEAGSPLGMNDLGVMYENGAGVEKDMKLAVEWYRKAALAGEPAAMNNLGVLYENGNGVAQDMKQAVEWYRKAAEAGNPAGMNNMGRAYENGIGVEKDEKQSVEWYRKGAENDQADAMNNLGCSYEKGFGVEQDQRLAAEWYQKAADAGSADAMFNLGWNAYSGTPIINYAAGVSWFQKAADAGSVDGMRELARSYQTGLGHGGKKNLEEARKWFQKAADIGDEEAKSALMGLTQESSAKR